MIELGKKQELTVKRKVTAGVYLGAAEGEAILLPNSQMTKDLDIGDTVEVFVYKDSEDRMISTMKTPGLEIGKIGKLKAVSVAEIGVFLDWGLDKDLFLPFKEQLGKVKESDWVMVGVYVDKSTRLCATMKIYDLLSCDSPYKVEDKTVGIVYEIKPGLGALIAVDGKYHGLIHEKELFGELKLGNLVEVRVLNKRDDGKLDLGVRGKAYKQMDVDSKIILDKLEQNNGVLNLHDKSKPEDIKRELNMSKNSFKRAIGRLYKNKRVDIKADKILLKK